MSPALVACCLASFHQEAASDCGHDEEDFSFFVTSRRDDDDDESSSLNAENNHLEHLLLQEERCFNEITLIRHDDDDHTQDDNIGMEYLHCFQSMSLKSSQTTNSSEDHLPLNHQQHHKTTENILKLSILSIIIIFYTFTWSKNHLTSSTSTTINDDNNNNSSLPLVLFSSNEYNNDVSLKTAFNLIWFLPILIIVSFVCEKLFGYHITISTKDCWSINKYYHRKYKQQQQLPNIIKSDPHIYRAVLSLKNPHINTSNIILPLICLLPWRLISKLWGLINQIDVPCWCRKPLFICYAKIFGCNLDEIDCKDLSQYSNLSQFFRRSLIPSVRPISQENGIVSPADGRIVQFETIANNGGFIGNVKGIHYRIDNFLGLNYFDQSFNDNWSLNSEKVKPGHRLYSCVIYLAPGDYHRFHSPVDWTIHHRRHFTGNLLSVKPSFVARIPNLFSINERVAYFGQWKYGFFSMTAVGATNVGSINVFFDEQLYTNQLFPDLTYGTEKTFKIPIHMKKGDLFGEFNLGSTMVLIYEAPINQKCFNIINQKVNYGQLLCKIY